MVVVVVPSALVRLLDCRLSRPASLPSAAQLSDLGERRHRVSRTPGWPTGPPPRSSAIWASGGTACRARQAGPPARSLTSPSLRPLISPAHRLVNWVW
jgi:hypothetical protein